MDIKRTGLPKPLTPATTPVKSADVKPAGKFDLDRAAGDAAQPELESGVLAEVRGKYSRADLGNEAKVDEMVNRSVNEIVDSWADRLGSLPESDRRHVAEILERDPLMRGRILNYLQKVLD